MLRKGSLTTEIIKKKFVSQFDLVNYAIKLATNMIQTGREARVRVDSQNRAMQIMSEIVNGKDQFDDVIPKITSHHHSSAIPTEKVQKNEEEAAQKAKPRKKKLLK